MTVQALSIFQSLIDWDTSITLLINGIHSPYWDNLMMLYSGKFVWIPFYLSLMIAMFRNFHWKPCAICLASMVLLLFMNDQMSSSVLRHAIGRMRPANLDNPISSMIHIVGGYRGGYYGFPSAHAANCWGLVFFLTFIFRNRLLNLTMIVWAILMCYSRIYLGVHYLGDTLAGMSLGFINATIIFLLLRKYNKDITQTFANHQRKNLFMRLPSIVYLFTLTIFALVSTFINIASL